VVRTALVDVALGPGAHYADVEDPRVAVLADFDVPAPLVRAAPSCRFSTLGSTVAEFPLTRPSTVASWAAATTGYGHACGYGARCSSLRCQVNQLPRDRVVSAAGHTGAAGHVALTFPSGGVLLAAAGHWVELQRVKTDERSFFNVMANEYGEDSTRNQQLKADYSALPTAAAQDVWLQENAQKAVQSRSCAKYSQARSKWGSGGGSNSGSGSGKARS
jgi:hypothetical protein